MTNTKRDKAIERFLERDLAISTLSRPDCEAADNLRAIARGDNELFRWGVGPCLERGSLVAIYVPKNNEHFPHEKGTIRRIYLVAADATRENRPKMKRQWRHTVFLYRRLTLIDPVRFEDLKFLTGSRIRFLGKHPKLSKRESRDFWQAVFDKNHILEEARKRLLYEGPDDVAVSYRRQDERYALRLESWCNDKDWNAFFVTAVEDVKDKTNLHEGLKAVLQQAYSQAMVGVAIIPRKHSRWTRLEWKAMMQRPDNVFAVRVDDEERVAVKGIPVLRFRKETVVNNIAGRLAAEKTRHKDRRSRHEVTN